MYGDFGVCEERSGCAACGRGFRVATCVTAGNFRLCRNGEKVDPGG